MDEQRLERALRQGPPFATTYIPAPLALDTRPVPRRAVTGGRFVLGTAVATLLLLGMLVGLAAIAALRDDGGPVSNGWVAFARNDDIFLVREGQAARRIIGSDLDGVDQTCPAFAPDGTRIAYGETVRIGILADRTRGTALVIAELDAAGNATEALRIEVGDGFPSPCAIWSADGRRVAFAVPLTSTGNPDRSAAGSAVWIATVADGHVEVLPDLLATDLEWSPVGSQLAIASGQSDLVPGESLRDGSISIYDADRGEMRTLVGPSGVGRLTWSPDGRRIAYQRGESDGGAMDQEIRVIQVDGSGEQRIARWFSSIRGIGPVWSPTGDHIVYQRMKGPGTEWHSVVLVTPDGESQDVLPDLYRQPGDTRSPSWRPSGVTWSPDGRKLLYTVWSSSGLDKALISVPIDPGADPTVLHRDAGMVGADGDGFGPLQSWGRLPDD